jgi:hypothetical protein
MKGARKAARYTPDPDADMDVDMKQESQEDLETPSGTLLRIRLENFMCRACPHGCPDARFFLPSHASNAGLLRLPNVSHV